MQQHALRVADFLPDIELVSVSTGLPLRLPPAGADSTVLVSIHSADCRDCLDYLNSLAPSSSEFSAWGGRLFVIVPGTVAAAARISPPFGQVLADEPGQLASPADAMVVVADRYGHIFNAIHAGTAHRFPALRELEEWLKFLGTLCPE